MPKHTKGPWRIGTGKTALGSVVSDIPCQRLEYSDDERASELEYYGGFLVAESITPENRALIAAAPALYDACKDAHRLLTVARELSDRRMAEQVVALAAVRLDCVTRDVDGAETEVSNG